MAPHEPTKHIENVTKGMKVTFPDGTDIWQHDCDGWHIYSIIKDAKGQVNDINIGIASLVEE